MGMWPRDQQIEAIRRWADAHDGEPPSCVDWQVARPGYPTAGAVRKTFGTWNAAIREAGLTPRARGRPRSG